MIHETAIISPSAKIADDVKIGPYSIIGDNVTIGQGSEIGPHVVIKGPTTIGKKNQIFQFSSIGEAPPDKKYKGENTELVIGDNNIIREYVTISRGTVQDKGKTVIGNDNLLMSYVHVAHDCVIHDHCIMANNASLAGHVEVMSHANLGGFVGVHQYCRIGSHSFCAGGSIIVQDVVPYTLVSGHPAQARGLNLVGLKRHGFSPDDILFLKRAYKMLYRAGLTVEEACSQILSEAKSAATETFTSFVQKSERGITR